MLIGLAGVTSTGKTTMATSIKERYGDKVHVVEKISRQEIYNYAGLNIGHDLRKATNEERAKFDIARIDLQMTKERSAMYQDKPVVIDGCTIVKVAYLIYLSAPFVVEYFGEKKLTEIVEQGIEFVNTYYASVFYLPVTRMPFAEADHRLFKNKYIRLGQDAILNRLLTSQIRTTLSIVSFPAIDINLVFDELSKLGVN